MNEQVILTIAIPTYNGSGTIQNLLDILLPQRTDSVEIIIADNCSTDETVAIIMRYKEIYPWIRVILREKNVGADKNFLDCMLQAKGKFVMLISDDDIITENSVDRIVSFLSKNPNVQLGYLDSVGFKDKYNGVKNCSHDDRFLSPIKESFVTKDKGCFYKYCGGLFGFTSSFVWNTDRIRSIEEPEKYFGSYFLQAYISIQCSNKENDLLAVIKGPCIAIGSYGIIANIDVAEVEGIYYLEMAKEAIAAGYPHKEFMRYYQWKIVFLCRKNIICEKAIGVRKTSISNIIKATRNFPKTWLWLYPFLLIPNPLCKLILSFIRKKQGRNFSSYVNRPTDD